MEVNVVAMLRIRGVQKEAQVLLIESLRNNIYSDGVFISIVKASKPILPMLYIPDS